MNPKVDLCFSNVKKWHDELVLLRKIVLGCDLVEELKWSNPCYTYHDSNILILGEFKDYCALSFFKGALIKDDLAILCAPGENSQSVRMLNVKSIKEIEDLEQVLITYIYEAIEIEKIGLKVDLNQNKKLFFPDELIVFFDSDVKFKTAFESLTPGRQRGYNLYFSAPAQSKTRTSRIESYYDKIMNGIGFHDCTCGLSKKRPYCDGSHKFA
jgi:uncharacterized protein YdeI (YjbR/CyaY-like superfamily)